MDDSFDHNLEVSPPNELKFKGPFNTVVTSHLILKNVGNKSLCYKVKTTAPRMYCVKPNSGLIEPTKEVDVSVMLQPFEFNPSEKSKHKFLIQSTVADDRNLENSEQLWKSIDKDKIKEIKLKCLFDYEKSAGDMKPNLDSNYMNVSNNAQPGLATTVDELKAQLTSLKSENEKLKQTETRLRKVALQDTVENSSIPISVTHDSKQSSLTNSMLLLAILCVVSFFIGILIAKFMLH